MKFKDYIQSEINQKEVEPSHDTWNRIQARIDSQPDTIVIEKSSKKWWSIAAVSIGLIICSTVYFSIRNEGNSAEIAKDKMNLEINNSSDSVLDNQLKNKISTPKEENSDLRIVNSVSNEPNTSDFIKEDKKKLTINNYSEIKQIDEVQINDIQQNKSSIEIVTNLDTVTTKQKKKANYVDPNMLLYSIENKEALKETNNQKTRIAVIDLNK